MFNLKNTLSVSLAALLCAAPVLAQDSGALVEALVRKGILNDQEAEEIRADLARDVALATPVMAVPGAKPVSKLSLGARLQIQYAGLSTDIANAADPADTNHFFLRRVYLVTKASFGSDWSMNITYDAAESLFDFAAVTYKKGDQSFDIGLRKAPLGFEELTSSGSLKAIERSGVTRYFIEPNNGRRLGASGYRVGLFTDGKVGDFFYSAAITNPERVGSSTDNGTAANNGQAFWAGAGYKGKIEGGSLTLGVAGAMLPDQGGKTLGAGNDLTIWSVYGDITAGNFQLSAEYLTADVDRGASATRDASPSGFWVLGAYKFTPKLEGVVRYSSLDTDGRGVNLSDSVRSSPSGGTMDKLDEMFVGANYYIMGNDLKWQFGYVWGKSEDTVAGAPAEAETTGFRSQFQVNF
jgi:hypothetical protein